MLQKTPCVSGSKAKEKSACGRSSDMPNGPLSTKATRQVAGMREGRQEQRVGPDREAREHAGDGAARRRPPPEKAAEEGRRELRDRGEGEQPDRGERRGSGHPVIGVAEEQDDDDRAAPDVEDEARPCSAGSQARLVPRSRAGTTISLEIMMASATLSTMTMAVAADSPPMKAMSVMSFRAGRVRNLQHEEVGIDRLRRARAGPPPRSARRRC